MKSAIKLVMGLSVLAGAVGAVGCSSSSDSGPKAVASAGSGNSSSGGGSSNGGSGSGTAGSGASDLPAGVPIDPINGWVDMGMNSLMIQGALFSYEDPTTMASVSDTIKMGTNCMKGTAAKVVMPCTIVAPATDCYGTTWGAAMGLNLNQPIDPTTMMGVMDPLPYDGSKAGITGFAFDVSGDTVPTKANFRFLINDMATNQYCSPPTKGIVKGPNVFYLKDLIEECWGPKATDKTGDTAVNNIVKIAWQVVTNASSAVPFDFCIDNIEALTTPAP